ncbi:MAG: adenylate/guanylate cyclase domain-containing protein [Myxococcales bacterium]|nr:adenylate/guanylate cyclase domain-containing protein [Myxococcales bacterium]
MESADSTTVQLFERELTFELLKAERRRIEVTIALLIVFAVMLTAIFTGDEATFRAALARPELRFVIVGIVVACIPPLLLLRRHVGVCIQQERPLHPALRYAEAITAVSIPTLASLFFAANAGPVLGLNGPPTMGVIVILVIWTLSFRPRVCLIAGLVAGAEYFGLYLLLAPDLQRELPGSLIAASPPYVVKAVLYALIGAAAAFVAHEFRVSAVESLRRSRERDRIRDVFGQHVSPQIVDALLERGGAHPAEARRVCVMFFDIRGFTTIAQDLPPESVVSLLNTLFAPLVDCVSRNGGVVNKFLGDGFMAIFGAPIPEEAAEARAVAASREVLRELALLIESGRIPALRVGIGLHAGDVVVGDVGSIRRKEYTLIGDTVNVAARVEELNKRFTSTMLASAAVVERLSDDEQARAEPLGDVEIRGREKTVELYKLA